MFQIQLKSKKIIKLIRKNYFFTIILLCLLLIGVIIASRTLLSKPTYVFVKIKVGQGLWWATTAKPSEWYVSSIRKGDTAKNLLGNTEAKIMSVKKYPSGSGNQYDIYLTLMLKASLNKRTGEYLFNRSTLSVGVPIEVQFPKIDLTGTVIDLSDVPFRDKYVEKTLYLIYQGGYAKDFPYRYDDIKIGDKFSNGEEYVFEVIDKSLEQSIWTVQNNFNALVYERAVDTVQHIVVKAKVKLLEKSGGLFYGEEYRVSTNAFVPFSTDKYYMEGFFVRKIE